MNVKKVIDYHLIDREHPRDFESRVTSLIGMGWQPWGAPFVSEGECVSQAMVKYEEPEILDPKVTVTPEAWKAPFEMRRLEGALIDPPVGSRIAKEVEVYSFMAAVPVCHCGHVIASSDGWNDGESERGECSFCGRSEERV